ncbi:MAG: dephospho-CoA kinase [Terriglobia bacterium]
MLKVGLTGGIASGKTTVAGMFAARDCRLLDADGIAHQVIVPGQPVYDEIVRTFGREILDADGGVDRGRLGSIVFAERARLEQLNRILHPPVIARIEREFDRLEEADPGGIVLLEAALLVETGYHRKLDKLIVTWCSPAQQLDRLTRQKGLSRAQAERRLAAQMPAEEKRRLADYEINCSGSLAATEAQVEKVFRELRRLGEQAARTE